MLKKLLYVILKKRVFASEAKYDKKLYSKMLNSSNPFPKLLTAKEKRKYKDGLYEFVAFKNYYEDFEKDKNYFISRATYACEVLPRLSKYTSSAPGGNFTTLFNDKNYFEVFFKDISFPKVIIRSANGILMDCDYKRISFEKAFELLMAYDEVFFKASVDTRSGEGVALVSKNAYKEMLTTFGEDFVVQEKIIQHDFLSNYNPSSVNIIRVTTLFWNGHCYNMNSRLRVGAPGAICDHSDHDGQYPVEVEILDDGSLGRAIIFHERHFVPDIFGKKIEGKIPNYDKLIKIAMENHTKYPMYGFIGWDFTIDKNGEPICVEVNAKRPSIYPLQCFYGPIFMQKSVDGRPLLDEIMETPIDYQHMRIL